MSELREMGTRARARRYSESRVQGVSYRDRQDAKCKQRHTHRLVGVASPSSHSRRRFVEMTTLPSLYLLYPRTLSSCISSSPYHVFPSPSPPFFQDATEDCIISLDDKPPSSPPRSLLPLMLTCCRFHQLLHPPNNHRLYRRMLYPKFDGAALARRFPHSSIGDASRFFP